MDRRNDFRSACLIAVCVVVMSMSAAAQPNRRLLSKPAARQSVSPLRDDANLHDVTFVGERRGWAVGDRGVIWRTDDGGHSWQLQSSGVNCSLRSVCFLTDRVGWIVGGGITPHVRTTYGVVLGTTDGGDTWSPLVDGELPLLHTVQFFGLDEGMAVCEASARFPSGVLETADGGKTWTTVPGAGSEGWRTGAFVNEDMGFVAGRLGRFTSVGGGLVSEPLTGASGLRGINSALLGADGRGWLAGDGGLVLKTENGGVSWRAPDGELPRPLRDVMDFQAVTMKADSVWLAGTPGSVVWHSPDGGQSWQSYATGQTTPIRALHFASTTHGWAVGVLGTILSTTDGGQTWTPSRAPNRRAAVLAMHAHESRVSLNLAVKYGLEEGYRTAVTLMARRDIGPDAAAGRTLDLRLNDATTTAGGTASSVDWAFPVAAPELDHHPKELIREWQLLTDNRLREVMLSRLIVQLRTWRPDVLVIDTPPPDDATTKLLGDAIKLAVQSAATNSQETNLEELLHLPPWKVKRAFQRLPEGSEGSVVIDAFEFLPRQGASIEMTAADAFGQLGMQAVTAGRRESYAVWDLDESDTPKPSSHFFAGLVLTPGSDARRNLSLIDDRDLERRQNLAQQQRNFAAYAARMLDDERHAAQIIGQTKDIVGTAPPEQAAVQLARLVDEYRRRGQWEHMQTTLFELVERYPEQPVAVDALRRLFLMTSSEEVTWQRLQKLSSASKTEFRSDGNIVQASVREALLNPSLAIQQTSGVGSLQFGGGVEQHSAKRSQWQLQANRVLQTLKRVSPGYFAEPAIQFPVAAFERSLKHPRESDAIINSYLSDNSDRPWNRIAAGEVWILQPATAPPGKVALCHRTQQAPYLDGLLNDPCWQQTLQIPLKDEAEHEQMPHGLSDDEGTTSFAQLAYDDRFLYIAARLPRVSGVEVAAVKQPGRTDDADLTGQDRLSLQFDVDRDYATFYRIDIDQRGWTADACWENESWNGERFIAVTGDSGEWRMEMAILLGELVAQLPQPGDTWAGGIVRIMPTVGIASWTKDAGSASQPQSFGLIRFE